MADPVTARKEMPPLDPWERLLLGAFSLASAVGMLFLSFMLAAALYFGLSPSCVEDADPFAITAVAVAAAVFALAWTAVSSMFVAAIRHRGFSARTWVRVAVAAATIGLVAGVAIIGLADYSQPAYSLGCDLYE